MSHFIKSNIENIIIPISCVVILVFSTFFFGGNLDLFLTQKYFVCFAITFAFYVLIIRLNNKLYLFILHSNMFKFYYLRALIGFVLLFLLFLITIFLFHLFKDIAIDNLDISNSLKKRSLQSHFNSMVIGLIIFSILFVFFCYKWYYKQQTRLKTQKIIASTANARFESLKNQIDPHFLFNSLNVLSALIEENPVNAQRFTTSLSKIYRYVLEQKDKELVPVQEELVFAKTYMNLLAMRFENSISFELPKNFEQSEAKVVPLSLQLLLENCIKHNVVSNQKPLHIRIFEKNNALIVENNLQKKDALQEKQGVGLQNIINRYGILTHRKVIVQEDNNFFSVHLPLLTKQITIMKETKTSPNTAYYRAKKRVDELKGFYGNLTAYCCVIPLLVFINLRYSPGFQWFWFSAAGWGFGLIMHAFQVFGYGKNWEENKIKEILNQYNQKNTWK